MSQIAEKKFPITMLLGGLSVNLNHLKNDGWVPEDVERKWNLRIKNRQKLLKLMMVLSLSGLIE